VKRETNLVPKSLFWMVMVHRFMNNSVPLGLCFFVYMEVRKRTSESVHDGQLGLHHAAWRLARLVYPWCLMGPPSSPSYASSPPFPQKLPHYVFLNLFWKFSAWKRQKEVFC
jgi:hypothetical protein